MYSKLLQKGENYKYCDLTKPPNLIYSLWVFQNIMSAYPAQNVGIFCNLIGKPVRPGYPAFPNISGIFHFFGI